MVSTRVTIWTKRFFLHLSKMYSNICKQIEREKKIKYFFVYTVHPFSISSAFPSLFLLSPAYFFLHHSRPQGQQCKHVFFSFLVGQPYGFWLIQLWERERTHSNWLFRQIFAKKRRWWKKEWIQTQWWLQICKFANEKNEERKKTQRTVSDFKPFINKFSNFYLTRFHFSFDSIGIYSSYVCEYNRASINK